MKEEKNEKQVRHISHFRETMLITAIHEYWSSLKTPSADRVNPDLLTDDELQELHDSLRDLCRSTKR